ncbi:hypothetical protein PUN28_012436 [Cardiocondyla obscurior]|uniref:Histone H3 n=1 Tax=Cardiocondyla obscurior TaxID=286306 RepID=A0AAW2FH93_9HYME
MRPAKPSQAKLSQAKPSQAKPSRVEPSQAKPGQAKPGQARPGNALDAASSRRMSHRRYGKPVRLGYKGPDSLSAPVSFSHSFFPVLPTPLPHAPLSFLYHRRQSALFYPFSPSLYVLLGPLYRDLTRLTVDTRHTQLSLRCAFPLRDMHPIK